MIKMTTDFVETSSLSSVTYHCQIMVVHCTQNCHQLVWPIYQADWSKCQLIWLRHHHYPVLPTTVKLRTSIAPKYATNSYDPYTKHNDQNDNRFCWNIIIIQCNLPLSNYGRPLHPKLPPTRMTHIPSTMIKMTTDFVETSSLSSVTYHCQITVVHCTQNCHQLVWPIYQAQWSKWQQILLKHHHYPVLPTTVKLRSSIAPQIATYSYDPYTTFAS